MPLPSVARFGALQCKATAKHTGSRCLNPGAFGMKVCRYHGARRAQTIKRGKEHPNYKHGGDTLEVRSDYRIRMKEIQELEALGHAAGLFVGARTPGPKIKLVDV